MTSQTYTGVPLKDKKVALEETSDTVLTTDSTAPMTDEIDEIELTDLMDKQAP